MEKPFEIIEEQDNVIDVDFTERPEVEETVEGENVEAPQEGEIKHDQPNWMSFLVGVRGDALYECKSNIDPTLLTDFIEASAAIDMNIAIGILKSNSINELETFFKMKEILVLNSVRLMQGNLESVGLTPEQYDQLRNFFGIDRIEAMLEQRKQEMVDKEAPVEEAPQA